MWDLAFGLTSPGARPFLAVACRCLRRTRRTGDRAGLVDDRRAHGDSHRFPKGSHFARAPPTGKGASATLSADGKQRIYTYAAAPEPLIA